eukprot:1161900-Pelagomonas_calceolata.AAC.2
MRRMTKGLPEGARRSGHACSRSLLASFIPWIVAEEFKQTLDQDEQKLGADIIKKALAYPLRLIANNAGVNGSVVMSKVSCTPRALPG